MKTCKMAEKSLKIHTRSNFRPKLSLRQFVVESVISYDEFIDDLVLYENYLICILMNINKTAKTCGKKQEKKLYSLQDIG